MARRPLYTEEQDAVCTAALKAAYARLEAEGPTPGAIAARLEAEAQFRRVQMETAETWPYTYDGGEVPMIGDEIGCLDEPKMPSAVVVDLAPPVLRVHRSDLGPFLALAAQHGAKIHPAMTEWFPQCCWLIRRRQALPEG